MTLSMSQGKEVSKKTAGLFSFQLWPGAALKAELGAARDIFKIAINITISHSTSVMPSMPSFPVTLLKMVEVTADSLTQQRQK